MGIAKKESDNSKRKNVNVATFKKVEEFLRDQKKPMFKSDIARKLSVDYDSLILVLGMLKVRVYPGGKIRLKC